MNCLPFTKQLFKFGRIISNMALKIRTTNKYNTLNNSKNSYNFPAFLDSESDNQLAGSYSLSASSGFISPKLSEASYANFSNIEKKRGNEDMNDSNFLHSIFDSFNLDENSTPATSPKNWKFPENSIDWEQSVNSLFDPSSKQFIDFENFVQSSHGFSDCSLFSYSPLSSLESISNDQNYNDLYCNDFSYRMQQECIRKEFEMNGKSVDVSPVENENFNPVAMSTPFVERKSDQYKLNYSNSNPTKLYVDEPQFVPTQQMNDLYQSYLKMNENIFDIQFPPVLSSVPYAGKPISKIQGRKRGHQSQHVLQNNLQHFNTNNPNFQFGKANDKKIDKKNSSKKKKVDDHCVFCKNNGADEILYKSHTVKDSKGRVLCPKLRAYKCPICGVDGDDSHTVKYCPKKPIVTMEDLKKFETSRKVGCAPKRL